MIQSWLQPVWQRLLELGERLPHALLFVGPPGLGKRALAETLAARLLCDAPAADGLACGRCEACRWRLAGNHPDLHLLIPAADAEAAAASEPEAERESGSSKAKSNQIVIEQIRALQATLSVTGHHSTRRVVILDPAEAMNAYTANALLKLLEEPPAGCVFVLVSSAPRRLLPTIRSRCQQWAFSRPTAAALSAWCGQVGQQGADLLAISNGMPLAAERLAAAGGAALLARFVRDVGQLGVPARTGELLRLAAQWDAWLKSKEALAAGFGLSELVGWMLRWVSDLAVLRLGGRVRFFPQQQALLSALASRTDVAAAGSCYNDLIHIARHTQHPLNLRLVLEDLLLRYAKLLNGVRT